MLDSKIPHLIIRANNIFNFHSFIENELERLKNEISHQKTWLEKQPVLQEFLNQIQFKLQEKNILFFRDIVTHFVQYVIQNDKEEDLKTINFDLSIRNGMPALKINAQTENGLFEKITSGGLKNVIATSLRVLALWRLIATQSQNSHTGAYQHRPFLFLDEPDCWIGNSSMPYFAELLSQLCLNFGLQILVVTHKDVSYFQPYARVYQISKDDGESQVQLMSDVPFTDNQKDVLDSVELENFKSFKRCKIDLHPNLTVIVGKSDSGKSVLMEAMNAIINNQSDDEMLRHGEAKAQIILNYDNHSLMWQRVRKTNTLFPQKVKYTLYQNGEKLREEFESRDVPAFATDSLKMRKIDDVDIHLALQDDMTFLFNPKISDQERAKILSLGKEAAFVHKMMDNLKDDTREAKSQVKMNSTRYHTILEHFVDFKIPEFKLEELLQQEKELFLVKDNLQQFAGLLNQYQKLHDIPQPLSSMLDCKPDDFNIHLETLQGMISQFEILASLNFNPFPALDDAIEWVDMALLSNLSDYQKIEQCSTLSLMADEYQWLDTQMISGLMNQIKHLERLPQHYLSSIQDNGLFSIQKQTDLMNIGIQYKKLTDEIQQKESELSQDKAAMSELEADMNYLEQYLHDNHISCPLCHRAI